MFYSSAIFEKTGVPSNTGTALVGVFNMISTFLATFLLARFGRKTLMWTISLIMAANLIGLGVMYSYCDSNSPPIGYTELVLILLYVCLFEFSLGSIVWLYNPEIMTEKGVTIATVANWTFTLIISLVTSTLINNIKGWTFIIFGIFCIICGFFVLTVVKETKGLPEK